MITYLDIAVRGRPTSTTPERTVEAMARLFGPTVPGTGDVLANRLLGLGALTRGHRDGPDSRLAYALGVAPGVVRRHAGRDGDRPDRHQRADDHARGDRPTNLGNRRLDQRSDPALGIRGVTALVLRYLYSLSRSSADARRPETIEPA